MLNYIVVMGRFTATPELKHTPSGVAYTRFALAVDRDFKGQNGEKEVDFIEVVAWRSTAEFVCKYFTKGRMAVATGRLQVRDWKDQNGNNRRTSEIVAESVYFGDSKKADAAAGESGTSARLEELDESADDGELPF